MNDDWSIFERAKQGDETAWCVLSDEYRPRLLGLAFLITRSHASAEDIAQEAFERLFISPPRRTAESLMPYLATIAYRLAIKEIKRRGRLTEIDKIEYVDDSPTPEDNFLQWEKREAVGLALSRLDKRQRTIIALRYQGEMSYEDIAGLLRIPLGTVKSRLFNAIKNCRKMLEIRGLKDDTSG